MHPQLDIRSLPTLSNLLAVLEKPTARKREDVTKALGLWQLSVVVTQRCGTPSLLTTPLVCDDTLRKTRVDRSKDIGS